MSQATACAIFRNAPVVSAQAGDGGDRPGEEKRQRWECFSDTAPASVSDAAWRGGGGGGVSTYSSRKDLLLEVKEKNRSHVSIPEQRRGRKAAARPQTCVVEVGRLDELGRHRLLVLAVLVRGHQPVHAVVDVGGVDQLQAAVVLALSGLVDPGADVVLLLEGHVLVVPLQVGFGVPLHAEGDAPVVVPLRLQQLLHTGGD